MTTLIGRLPPEVIQRVVRTHFGGIRRCYEDALRAAPGLGGTVSVKFVIALDGHVASAADSGLSTLPDTAVVACVVRALGAIEFPRPEGAAVTVVYPIIFSPGASP